MLLLWWHLPLLEGMHYSCFLFCIISFSVKLHFTLCCCPIYGTISVAQQSGEMCTLWRLGRMQCMWWCPCVLIAMLCVYIVSTNVVRSVVSLALRQLICICNKLTPESVKCAEEQWIHLIGMFILFIIYFTIFLFPFL